MEDARSQSLFTRFPAVRYVAIRDGDALTLRERAGVQDASSGETDRYEELLVNPALLVLTQQRGKIDCGGLRFLMVRYGNFWALVIPTARGHVAVAIEPSASTVEQLAESIAGTVSAW